MWEFLIDFWHYMRARKKFWLAPLIIVMLILGGLIVFAEGSAIAPLIYTLFYARQPRLPIPGRCAGLATKR